MISDILYQIAYSLAFAFSRLPANQRLDSGKSEWFFTLDDNRKVKVTAEYVEDARVENAVTYAGFSLT